MKLILRWLVILLLMAIVCDSYGQKQGQSAIDSMLKDLSLTKEDTKKVTLLNTLSYFYSSINPEVGVRYGMQGLELAKKMSWDNQISMAYGCIGVNYMSKPDYPLALEYLLKNLKLAEDQNDKKGIGAAYLNIGNVYQTTEDYPNALEYYFKTIKIGEYLGDKTYIERGTEGVGVIYQYLKNYPKALEYDFKALKMDESTNDRQDVAIVTANIGVVYAHQRKYAQAMEYYSKSLKIHEEIGDKYYEANDLQNIGECLLFIAKDTTFNPSTDHVSPGIAIPVNKTEVLINAISYLQKCVTIAKEIPAPDILKPGYASLSEAYKLSGDYKKALEYSDNFIAIRDSIFSKEGDKRIARMEYNEKEKISKIKLQQQKGYTFIGILGAGLLLCFTFFIAWNNKLLSKEKKRSENLLLNILPGEIAEELKNNGTAAARYYDNVTVMFTDFVNFTITSQRLTPQELIDELDTCFKAFDDIIGKYDIEKIKTIGDAYLAVCGLPAADPRHAEKMVTAANEINTYMRERYARLGNKTFEIRLGVHSGNVVAGIVGKKKFAYDIWGDTVNTAARMEQNSEAGKINISETTYELVKDKFKCEYRGEIDAKGKGMMKMYFVSE